MRPRGHGITASNWLIHATRSRRFTNLVHRNRAKCETVHSDSAAPLGLWRDEEAS
jgi:hypothetical protein